MATIFERMAAVWWLRYMFGASMLIGAAVLASSTTPNAIHGILAFGIVGMYCLREFFWWLLALLAVGTILYVIIGALGAILGAT